MVSYLYCTPEQQQEMLASVGAGSIDELFHQIPESLRLTRLLDLPAPLTEMELQAEVSARAAQNGLGRSCFLGGGAYDHFIPAVVDEVTSRGEFYTAYTPYQPEASQGSLQAFFEYQTLICQLTGMDVSNASLYEGGTAVSEAAFMAMRVTGREGKVVILGSVHPEYRQVLETYTRFLPTTVVTIPVPNGVADVNRVIEAIDDQTACVIFQQPNFFGCLEEVEAITKAAQERGALAVVSFDPISLGMLRRPGDYGADIAVAEGQSLGTPLQYGGPYLGVLACRDQYVRKMPGRLVASTTDRHGNSCYVLGLQTREQHIRRDKATSNICTNQGLLALRATVYLSLLGPQGIQEVAELSCRKAHYAADRLREQGATLKFDQPFFKEFVLQSNDPTGLAARAATAGFDVGPELLRTGSDIADGLLVAVTEQRTRVEIDRLVDVLKQT
ncbi:MAG: aminomethyl-transferring glycine dehydrogenase subunit GcvPA [Planctomycetaceae bacterium]